MAQSACQGMRVVTHKEAVQSMIVRPQTTRDIGEQLSAAQQTHCSEIVTLVKLILVLPATNATSKRTFSALRTVKSYLRATMGQERRTKPSNGTPCSKAKTNNLNLIDWQIVLLTVNTQT